MHERFPKLEELPMNLTRARRRAALEILSGAVILSLLISLLVWRHRYTHPNIALDTAAVAVNESGMRIPMPADARLTDLHAGTRVIVRPGRGSEQLAAQQEDWLHKGRVPGVGTKYEDLSRFALLDMKVLTEPAGTSIAGWAAPWHLVWPRDASFVAAAFAQTGHYPEALAILDHLGNMSQPETVYEARYRVDGAPVLDGRPTESDGTGWAMWALGEVANASEDKVGVYRAHRELLQNLTSTLLKLTDSSDALPPASADYWEIKEKRLTLGVAAPILIGLRSAATSYRILGDSTMATLLTKRADKLADSIRSSFGPIYPRHLGASASDRDASIGFLLPPFFNDPEPALLDARAGAITCMRRPAGGVAPGCSWKSDGVSWTPETSLFLLNAAALGRRAEAVEWLDFLLQHSTSLLAIPEKVLRTGAPASVAPLGWSDACVVLALAILYP
jgi:glucoamylase